MTGITLCLLSSIITDLTFTPVVSFFMVLMAYVRNSRIDAFISFPMMYVRNLIISIPVGFIVVFVFAPLLYKLALKILKLDSKEE
ncbi:MAG: hypothetical protein K6E10_05890 [Eubacterium sp.]|nr:hypothetical protein [Eubacterium sp.]